MVDEDEVERVDQVDEAEHAAAMLALREREDAIRREQDTALDQLRRECELGRARPETK